MSNGQPCIKALRLGRVAAAMAAAALAWSALEAGRSGPGAQPRADELAQLGGLQVRQTWTGPHTPCVWWRPYDGGPAVPAVEGATQKAGPFIGGGLLEQGPDRQSATVCASPLGERLA